jgi:hypothetical protein
VFLHYTELLHRENLLCFVLFSVRTGAIPSSLFRFLYLSLERICEVLSVSGHLSAFLICHSFSNGSTAPVGQGVLIIEASRSHSDTPHSVGLLWRSDQPVAETFTWKHTRLTRETSMPPAGFGHTIPANDRSRGRWIRQFIIYYIILFLAFCLQKL